MNKAILTALILSTVLLRPAGTTGIISPVIVLLDAPVAQPIGPARINGTEIKVDHQGTSSQFQVICGSAFRFDWLAEAGKDYEVEVSKDLRTWQKTGVVIEGRGLGESWYSPNDGNRFFRITSK